MLVLYSEAASRSHLDVLTQAGLAESAFEISSGVKSLDYFVFFIFFHGGLEELSSKGVRAYRKHLFKNMSRNLSQR